MSEGKVLIFAGTTEGRRLAEALFKAGIPVAVSVATEYGESLLPEGEGITHLTGRMDREEMVRCMRTGAYSQVIDATHPYAVIVSENVRQAAAEAGIPYLRLLREMEEIPEGRSVRVLSEAAKSGEIFYAGSVKEACEALAVTEGKILASTGSKELSAYTLIPDYKNRVVARVLSTEESVAISRNLGFEGKNLICMQGPFSEEMNIATMHQYGIRFLVTKASGKSGGFSEKLSAAKKAGAAVIIIGRPEEPEGYSFEAVYRKLLASYGRKPKGEITLVSIGAGTEEHLTGAAKKCISQADAYIGAGRMLEMVKNSGKPMLSAYKNEEILSWIEAHPQYEKVAVIFSGDTGFYSGAKKLFPLLREKGYEVSCIPGVSSLVYLAARLGISWDDAKLMSIHGRTGNLPAAVRENKKVFTLLGGKDGVKELCSLLLEAGLSKVTLHIGEELSYPEERILSGTPEELLKEEFGTLTAAFIENPEAGKLPVTHGIPDEEFIRDQVPMTKWEVRAAVISAMQLRRDSVIYDVGAGTGSVSIEAALQASEGFVYAIERKKEACELIRQNQKKFGCSNLSVVEGLAPEALSELPAPDVVFIGGSAGNMREILSVCFSKNPKARIVITAIALETVAEVTELLKTLSGENVIISQITTARAKKLGGYQLMMGQNPVTLFAFDGKEEN